MDGLILARVLHILAVVVWIGGVAMVTGVIIPAVRRGELGADRLAVFHAIKRRFVNVARAAIIVVGLSGLYMTAALDLWDRFRAAEFWWMHAMVCVWLLFAVLLFVVEPLGLRRRFRSGAARSPDIAFARFQRAHWVLLVLALLTLAGAVAGSHGWY